MNIVKETLRSLFNDHNELAGYESIVNSMIEIGNSTTVKTIMQLDFGIAQKYISFSDDDISDDIVFVKFDRDSAIKSTEAQQFLLMKKVEILINKKKIEEQFSEINKNLNTIKSLIKSSNRYDKEDLIDDYSIDYQKAYLAKNIPHK